jgi:hypothetical protein
MILFITFYITYVGDIVLQILIIFSSVWVCLDTLICYQLNIGFILFLLAKTNELNAMPDSVLLYFIFRKKILIIARLDLKPHLLRHVWLGHCFKAVTLPYLLLIRRFSISTSAKPGR